MGTLWVVWLLAGDAFTGLQRGGARRAFALPDDECAVVVAVGDGGFASAFRARDTIAGGGGKFGHGCSCGSCPHAQP